jgi:hypothetical protein
VRLGPLERQAVIAEMGPTKSKEAGTVWNIELVLEVRGVTSCKRPMTGDRKGVGVGVYRLLCCLRPRSCAVVPS